MLIDKGHHVKETLNVDDVSSECVINKTAGYINAMASLTDRKDNYNG